MNASYRTYKSQSIQELLTPPETPSTPQSDSKLVHTWPEPETEPEEISIEHQDKYASEFPSDTACNNFNVTHQEVLLLHGPKQKYIYNREHPIPSLQNDREMLIAVHAVGLNPIDWKAPDFGFGLPALPCISGRDFAGKVVMTARKDSRFKVGDLVMAVSTDYRDSRKAAYQQYSVVSDFNACRIPDNIATTEAAPLGVAFVAAALALGICFGVDFTRTSSRASGPDLLHMVRSLSRESLPKDIRAECFDGITEDERPEPGEWIAIWGGSSATGRCVVQLAKLAGFKVIAIIDVARSGERMLDYGADLLVDRIDTERAISIVQGVTKGRLRFGFNAHGRETAKLLTKAMHGKDGKRAHLVGLTGLPKEAVDGIVYHSVPIKCFHEAPQVGEALMIWLEQLLEQNVLSMLDIEVAPGGLEGINAALDRLRDGSVSARIVVPLDINQRQDTNSLVRNASDGTPF